MNVSNHMLKNTWGDRYKRFGYHLIAWVVFIFYELIFAFFIFHLTTPLKDYIFFYACNISLFYVNCLVLDKCLDRPQPQYLLLVILIVVELTAFLIIKGIWEYFAFVSGIFSSKPRSLLKIAIWSDFSRNLYYLFTSTVIWSITNYNKFQQRIMDLSLKKIMAEKAHTELQYQFSQAQNAFLKQQINPHLLFNTLNTIYSTVYRNSPENSEAVLLLSEIMRYSFEEAGHDGRVPLDKELLQLQSLIKLNAYRFDQAFTVDYTVSGVSSPHTIIPLVLITLTENMFKHGDLRFSPRSINIAIDEKGLMNFTTMNVPKVIRQPSVNTHVGLANTRLRLDYAYPGNYMLHLTETDELFQLELTINLKS